MSVFHEFEVDKAIISDLIHSQNGTISTAIRELVMNAIDAGSKTCHIKINPHSFSVSDSGRGFQSKENIERVFKRFGEPHVEGDATFGRFRIGRGQIMSFAAVTWHSSAFKMHTNVRKLGNGFELSEDENNLYQGCRVFGNFYNKLDSLDISRIQEEISSLVKFTELDITFNGIPLVDTQTAWDFEDDDVKIKWSPNRMDGISLYSLGIYVKELNRYYYGVNADIVTKRALKLNMARNEINDQDPLWIKIDSLLKEHSKELAQKEPKLTEERRKSLIFQLISGSIGFKDVLQLPLIKDCRGKSFSIRTLISRRIPLTLTPTKNLIADEICNSRVATVIDVDELRHWKANDLYEWITSLQSLADEESSYRHWYLDCFANIHIVDIEQLQSAYDHQLTIIKQAKLTPRQSAARNAIDYASKIMSKRLSSHLDSPVAKRKILLGKSQVADGWTDGVSFIAVSNSMIPYLDKGYYGAIQIALLLLHEYCHDEADTQSHGHDFAFYEKFHDLSSVTSNEIVGHTAQSLYKRYQDELTKKGLALPKEVTKQFKWPVVNNVIEVTGFLESPLSDFAKAVLDAAPCTYKLGRKKIEIVFCDFDYKKYSPVQNLIKKKIQDAGITLPDTDSIQNATGNFHRAQEIIGERLNHSFEQFSDKSGLAFECIKTLFNCSSYQAVLQGLCLDRGGLQCYEFRTVASIRTVGSAHVHYRHTLGRHGWEFSREDVGAITQNPQCRTEYALNGIKHIIDGITDKAERQRFINTFFTENLINQLEQS
ncbi:ATP-binding protein [Photobacterium damselae]|uniref:ATP-binding protein n=1 Tax=Photobacterium damselae TaxID=38293 RepID=UPI0040679215